jgi:hypothetical protein
MGGVMLLRREDGPRYAVQALESLTHPGKRHFADRVADGCAAAAGCEDPDHYSRLHNAECREQKRLLLDVLPPFPASDGPRWAGPGGGTPARLARAVDEERAYERLPILADALEEAGGAGADILSHLRGPGPHTRGCWALDLVLGRQ